jgi:hypothetical protein
MGADPDHLERAASGAREVAAALRRSSVRLSSAAPAAWRGRRATRWWSDVRRLAGRIERVELGLVRLGADLREQADQQRRASLAAPAHRLWGADRRGDGRWVSRVGDGRAEVVVVVVPGVGTDLGDRHDLAAQAERLWSHLAAHAERGDRRGAGGADAVAVVAWLGYDPPDHLLGGIDRRPARLGAARLVDDVASLRRRGATTVVLVGHSYGGLVVAGAGARSWSDASGGPDQVVLLGAPGIGDLPARPGGGPRPGVWAAAAAGDPISALARTGLLHGPDPLAGARRLPTSRPGHGAYLEDPVLLSALAGVATSGLRSGDRRAEDGAWASAWRSPTASRRW